VDLNGFNESERTYTYDVSVSYETHGGISDTVEGSVSLGVKPDSSDGSGEDSNPSEKVSLSVRNSGDNVSGGVSPGGSVKIFGEFNSTGSSLDSGWLSTNETGTWQNKTSKYFNDSLSGEGEWVWNNFTWSNSSVSSQTVGWRLYANNSDGKVENSPKKTFDVGSDVSSVVTETITIDSFSDWADGSFNGTTPYKPKIQDNLSLGYRNGTTNDNLVGYWRFDSSVSSSGGVLADYSGFNNETTTKGSVETGREGVFNTSSIKLDEDQKEDYVKTSESVWDSDSDFTVTAWVNPTSEDAYYNKWSILSEQNGNYRGTGFVIFTNNAYERSIRLSMVDSSGTFIQSNSEITNTWTHVAATWDESSGTARIYINGSLDKSGTLSLGDTNVDDHLVIGQKSGGTTDGAGDGNYFDGKIDEPRIYDVKLSSSKIEDLFLHGNVSDFQGNYTGEVFDPSGVGSVSWTGLNISVSGIDGDTELGLNASSLETGSGTDTLINSSLNNGLNQINLSSLTDGEKIQVRFNGTTSNVTKSWQISDYNISYQYEN
jgi:hypothetical protein